MQKVGGSNPSAPTKNSSVFRLFNTEMVDIAQLVSASGCGPEGRRFESDYPPHNFGVEYPRKRSLDKSRLFVLSAVLKKFLSERYQT